MASMTNAVDVRTAAAEFDRAAVADVESAAEDERKQVLAQFPLEEWAELPLERYALGQAAPPGSGPTYCRLLEFLTPNLGSIRGGSAAKHIMYHHNSGEWRLAAPLRNMDPQDAWAELRGQFVRALDAVGAGDFEALDDLEVLRYGPTLVTKSLATYFPAGRNCCTASSAAWSTPRPGVRSSCPRRTWRTRWRPSSPAAFSRPGCLTAPRSSSASTSPSRWSPVSSLPGTSTACTPSRRGDASP